MKTLTPDQMIEFTRRIQSWIIRQSLKSKAKQKQRIKDRLSQKEKVVAKIIKDALYDKSNVLLTAPISGKKFIRMPDQEMFIIINDCNVIISNHKFYYDIDLSMDLAVMISNRFDKVLEHQRHLMEKEMTANIMDGLGDISNTLQERIKEQRIQYLHESNTN